MNRKTALCWREAKRIAAKSSQLHLKNEQYYNNQIVDQEIEITTQQPTTFLPLPQTKKACAATTKQVLPKCWCDPRRCRCPPGDRDNDDAATPEIMLAQSQTAMMFSDPRRDVPAQS